MKPKNTNSTNASPAEAARVFAAATDAAIRDLEERVPAGMAPLEQALAARIRHAASQLLVCADQLASDELMVLGSTGQRRPHPLLKTEQDFRREIGDSLEKLTFRAEQHAMFVQAQAVTKHRAPDADETKAGESKNSPAKNSPTTTATQSETPSSTSPNPTRSPPANPTSATSASTTSRSAPASAKASSAPSAGKTSTATSASSTSNAPTHAMC